MGRAAGSELGSAPPRIRIRYLSNLSRIPKQPTRRCIRRPGGRPPQRRHEPGGGSSTTKVPIAQRRSYHVRRVGTLRGLDGATLKVVKLYSLLSDFDVDAVTVPGKPVKNHADQIVVSHLRFAGHALVVLLLLIDGARSDSRLFFSKQINLPLLPGKRSHRRAGSGAAFRQHQRGVSVSFQAIGRYGGRSTGAAAILPAVRVSRNHGIAARGFLSAHLRRRLVDRSR